VLVGVVVAQVARPEELRQVRGRPVAIAAAGAAGVVAVVTGALDVLADRQARAALVALDGGRISRAEQHAQRAVSLRPDVVRYRLAAQRAHAASGTVEGDTEALQNLDAALGVSPQDPVVRSEKAEFLLTRAQRTLAPADIGAAAAYLRALVAEDPVNAELQLRMGVAAALAGDDAGAERAWLAAESLAPRSASASTNLAALYARQGRWQKVDAAARRAVQREPASETARRLLAESAEHGT
jgi:tetratricopeptide (TPR) repeat protein